MELHGTINHIALTVSDLDQAMKFYTPLLEALGYVVGQPMLYNDSRLTVNLHELHGTAVNIWQATKLHSFDAYEPGLHHVAFNVSSSSEVDRIHRIVVELGADILDGPAQFPFSNQGYYALYFLDPDSIKIEIVYMSGLSKAVMEGKASDA